MMTPDRNADTLLGATGCAGRQPGVQRHDARLDAEADEEQQKGGVARTGGQPVRIFRQSMKAGKAISLRAVIADTLPTAWNISKKPSVMQPVPMCDMTK